MAFVAPLAAHAETPARLQIAPPAAWVRPVALPALAAATTAATTATANANATVNANAQDGPVRLLLADHQVHFSAASTSLFTRRALAVTAPEGLAALARVSLEWNVETDHVTLHAFALHRGTTSMDLLKLGQPAQLLRRRANPSQSAIDATVAASLPVPGLAVGDIVELAYTIERSEPLLAGHHDMRLDAGTQGGVDRLAITASWDRDLPMAVASRYLPGNLALGEGLARLDSGPVSALPLPEGAPDRFRRGRELEFSDYRNWGEVAAIFTPLFDKARRLPSASPLHAEIARIKAASPDPAIRAALALSLAEDSVRYLYVGLAQGNLRPASAEETWARGFGDCKGKTALLLALLDGLGIAAEPALVSVKQGDGLPDRLPGVTLFDHVIIRAIIAGQTYWLDPTRSGDTSLASLPVPDFRWALLLHPASERLVAIAVPPPAAPTMVHDLRLDASRGLSLPAQVHATMELGGDIARTTYALLARVPEAKWHAALAAVWQRQYPYLVPTRLSHNWDEASQKLILALDGTAQMDWNLNSARPHYAMHRAALGLEASFTRQPGPDADAPFALAWPDFTEHRETLILPGPATAFRVEGQNINQTLANRALYRRLTRRANVITMVAHTRPLAPELAYDAAQAAAEPLRQLAQTPVLISVNARAYVLTAEEARMAGGRGHAQAGQVALAR